jgi:GH24 family phage-related lysozyme (muramidase)
MQFDLSASENVGFPATQVDQNFPSDDTDSSGPSCPRPPKIPKKKKKRKSGGKHKGKALYAQIDDAGLQKINAQFGTQMNFKALANFEGGSRRDGYVPTLSSGVTIDTGFDLGQHSPAEIGSLGLPQPLVDKLTPYAGLKGSAAKEAMKNNPLLVSDAEANQITQAVQKQFLQSTINTWNKRATKTGGTQFNQLTAAQQTVLMSRTYHQGTGMAGTKIAKQFYAAAQAGNWTQAEQALRNYGGGKIPGWYKNRVNSEANLLKAENNAKPSP